MPHDHFVEEVRRVREAQAAKHGFDVRAILAAARKRQRRSGREVLSVATGKKPNNRLRATVRKSA